MTYGACKKNHSAAHGSVWLDGCIGFVGRKPGDSHCVLCGCHVGFHVQPEGAAHQLAAISVDLSNISFGACKNNKLGLNEKNVTIRDGCQRFLPTPEPKNQGGNHQVEPCLLCGCPKIMHEAFYSTPQAEASIILYTGENHFKEAASPRSSHSSHTAGF